MSEHATDNTVKLRAYSPGQYPILIVQLPSGELRVTYYETAYNLQRSKPAEEEWLRENAIGRHNFVPMDSPQEVEARELGDYVLREIFGGEV